jgi:hypothetical protein
MAIKIGQREDMAPKVQEVLTRNGCMIRMRLGLHETDACHKDGLILLQLQGSKEEVKSLEQNLVALADVHVKYMEI